MEAASALKALGDPGRLRALLLLQHQELTVSELTAILAVAQSTTSGMLRVMMTAGLVAARREGRHAYYRAAENVPWVQGVLSTLSLSAEDQAALSQVRRARLVASGTEDDPLAGAFDGQYIPGRSWKSLARSLLLVSRFGVVADLGVGTGDLTLLLARSAERVYAVDREPQVLAELMGRASDAGFEHVVPVDGDFEDLRLPEPDDLVVLSLSLHFARSPGRVVAEAFRNLRPGGRIWITELAAHQEHWVGPRLGHTWPGFESERLQSFLRHAGFEDITVVAGGRDRRSSRFRTWIAAGKRPDGEQA